MIKQGRNQVYNIITLVFVIFSVLWILFVIMRLL